MMTARLMTKLLTTTRLTDDGKELRPMATATELTLALGRTLYGGDPQDDETIRSREVRVSVTWRLGEDEQDLPLTVSVLAEEALRALDCADGVAHGAASAPGTTNHETTGIGTKSETTARPGTMTKPETMTKPGTNGTDGNGRAPSRAPGNGHGQSFGNGHGRNGGETASAGRVEKQPGPSAPASARPGAVVPNAAMAQSPATSPPSFTPFAPITAPQRLAIRSLCTKMELADAQLSVLLEERFGKRRLEELNKADAGTLLDALQRGAWEDEENEAGLPAYAN